MGQENRASKLFWAERQEQLHRPISGSQGLSCSLEGSLQRRHHGCFPLHRQSLPQPSIPCPCLPLFTFFRYSHFTLRLLLHEHFSPFHPCFSLASEPDFICWDLELLKCFFVMPLRDTISVVELENLLAHIINVFLSPFLSYLRLSPMLRGC